MAITFKEMSLIIDYLRGKGMTEADINGLFQFVASGTGLVKPNDMDKK